MHSIDVSQAGTFEIGGEITVNRFGFGAMRITGKGVWGDPPDRARALETLRMLPEIGINLIDTADSYGPYVSEELIRDALHPYKGMLIATKGGQTRHGPDIWRAIGHPDYLRQCVLMSLRRLGLEQIDLWQLHRVGTDCSPETQFEAVAKMREEGLIRHVGLSGVDVAMIKRARKFFPVVTVQNRYNLVVRDSEDVFHYCAREGIGFIPYAPLAYGALAHPGSALEEAARKRNATAGQIALAWLLCRSPVMLPIPGTGSPDHLLENARAASIKLDQDEIDALDALGMARWKEEQGAR